MTTRVRTPARTRRIIMRQMADGYVKEMPDFGFVLLCGCGCGTFLRENTPVIEEHLHALGLGGGDEEENRRLFFRPCADKKTNGTKATSYGSDRHAIAKLDRLTGKTKTGPKRKIAKRHDPWGKERRT